MSDQIAWRKKSLMEYYKLLLFQWLLLVVLWAFFLILIEGGDWFWIPVGVLILLEALDVKKTFEYVKGLRWEIQQLEKNV